MAYSIGFKVFYHVFLFCINNMILMLFQATKATQVFLTWILFLFLNSSDSLLSGSLVYLDIFPYFFLNTFVCIFIIPFLYSPIPELLFFSHENVNRLYLSVAGWWDIHSFISFSWTLYFLALHIIFLSLRFGPWIKYFLLHHQGKV